jgi:hypothetical protein
MLTEKELKKIAKKINKNRPSWHKNVYGTKKGNG